MLSPHCYMYRMEFFVCFIDHMLISWESHAYLGGGFWYPPHFFGPTCLSWWFQNYSCLKFVMVPLVKSHCISIIDFNLLAVRIAQNGGEIKHTTHGMHFELSTLQYVWWQCDMIYIPMRFVRLVSSNLFFCY
jgi:hypothetical protein